MNKDEKFLGEGILRIVLLIYFQAQLNDAEVKFFNTWLLKLSGVLCQEFRREGDLERILASLKKDKRIVSKVLGEIERNYRPLD